MSISLQQLTERACGPCTACCSVTGVSELGKPYYVRCQHQSDKGCGIHGNHPQSCKGFFCFWVLGFGTQQDRPDLLGWLAEASEEWGKIWIDLYATKPDHAPEEMERLFKMVNTITQHGQERNPNEFGGVRIHDFNATIGVQYLIKPPYRDNGYYKTGSTYVPVHGNDMSLLYYAGTKAETEKRLAGKPVVRL